MGMLECYLEAPVEGRVPDRAGLFRGLAVEDASELTTEEHLAHPVIQLSLGRCAKASYDETVGSIASKVAEEYVRHDYLLESATLRPYLRSRFVRLAKGEPKNDEELCLSLSWLSELLHAHHGAETAILIDEYDTPVTDGYLNGYRDEIVSFYRAWLTDALKATENLFLAALTGILRVSQESIFSELNNVDVNTMLDGAFGEAFGFTEAEVAALADHLGKPDLVPAMREWYDGYRSGDTAVYNPWSVIKFLRSGEAQPYWSNTSMNGIVRRLVRDASERTSLALARVASGGAETTPLDMQTVFDDLAANPDAVWPQLYQAGYLTTDDTGAANDDLRPRRLRLPNLEVGRLFTKELVNRAQSLAGSRESLEELHTAVRGRDEAALEAAIETIMLDSPPSLDLSDEGRCHMLLLGLLYGMEGYRPPTSNREAGHGRADVLLEPEPGRVGELPAVAMEARRPKDELGRDLKGEALKADARDVALAQALDNEYAHGMRGARHIFWGVSFAGKRVACACEVRSG